MFQSWNVIETNENLLHMEAVEKPLILMILFLRVCFAEFVLK